MPASAAYMHQLIGTILVHIMVFRLSNTKPSTKQMLGYCHLDPWEQTSVTFSQNTTFFIHENATKNIVCEMATILSSGVS